MTAPVTTPRPLHLQLGELGFNQVQIAHAVDAGCLTAEEAVALLYDNVHPPVRNTGISNSAGTGGVGARPLPIVWDAPADSTSGSIGGGVIGGGGGGGVSLLQPKQYTSLPLATTETAVSDASDPAAAAAAAAKAPGYGRHAVGTPAAAADPITVVGAFVDGAASLGVVAPPESPSHSSNTRPSTHAVGGDVYRDNTLADMRYADLRSDVGAANALVSMSASNRPVYSMTPPAPGGPTAAANTDTTPAVAPTPLTEHNNTPSSQKGSSWAGGLKSMLGLGGDGVAAQTQGPAQQDRMAGQQPHSPRALSGASPRPIARPPHEPSASPGDVALGMGQASLSGASSHVGPTPPGGSGRTAQPSVAFQEHQSEEALLRKAIELSKREQQDRELQEALRLSKVEAESGRHGGGGDPELMMAIQQSLKDTSSQAEAWTAPAVNDDPRARRRMPRDAPVGLRNIGNTCYLNSLLQVYFNLTSFRCVILQYEPPEEILAALDEVRCQGRAQGHSKLPRPGTPHREPLSGSRDSIEAKPSSGPVSVLDSAPPNSPTSTSGSTHSLMHVDSAQQRTLTGHCAGSAQILAPADLWAIEFVIELQRLFAKMSLGNQKYADPSALVRAMRDTNGKPIDIGGQQDASEFNSLFLDIVERAMSYERDTKRRGRPTGCDPSAQAPAMASSIESMRPQLPPAVQTGLEPATAPASQKTNIVKQMFSASFTQHVTILDGASAADVEEIAPISESTIALVVDATSCSHRDLLYGLDDYMHAKIDYSVEERRPDVSPAQKTVRQSLPALKSVWFTSFAPVLTIYLQRVRFNRDTSEAEKVHDQFTFPNEIAIDRYLEQNRKESELARSIVARIRAERTKATTTLRRLRDFPYDSNSGIKRYDATPNSTALESCFPRISPEDMSSTDPGTSKDTRSPAGDGATCADDMHQAMSRVRQRVRAAMHLDKEDDPLFVVEGLDQISAQAVLNILERIDSFDQGRVSELEQKLLKFRNDEISAYQGLEDIKYKLHAVLIHDGAPTSGHYWSFIRNSVSSTHPWLKFNDTQVTGVSEEEMLMSSQGGRAFASAYCLIYVLDSSQVVSTASSCDRGVSLGDRAPMDLDVAVPDHVMEEHRNLLPLRCVAELDASNAEFSKEVESFERANEIVDCKRKAREIVEGAIVALRRAETSLIGLPFSSTVSSPSAEIAGKERRAKMSSRARTLMEFCLASDARPSALVHALAASWSAQMPAGHCKSELGFLDYLGGPSHRNTAYPPLGSSSVVPSARERLKPVELVVEEMATLLQNSETEFPGEAALLPRFTANHISALLRGSVHVHLELENALELKAYYKFAIRAMSAMSAALSASMAGNWPDALGFILLVLRQDTELYETACSGGAAGSLAQLFKSSTKMAFSRRADEALLFLPAILKAVGMVVINETHPSDFCDGFSTADFAYCRILDILELLRALQRAKSGDSSKGPDSESLCDLQIHITLCDEVIAQLGPHMTTNIEAKRKASDENLRSRLAMILRNSDLKACEAVALDYEVLSEKMGELGCDRYGIADVTKAALRLIESGTRGTDFAPVA